MAGDDGEVPVRYRGEPPRYSERVVDPENPVPPRRGSRRTDEWDVEAYTPGEPRAADWDDAPMRPRREPPGTGRKRSDYPSMDSEPVRAPRGERRGATSTGRGAQRDSRNRNQSETVARERGTVAEPGPGPVGRDPGREHAPDFAPVGPDAAPMDPAGVDPVAADSASRELGTRLDPVAPEQLALESSSVQGRSADHDAQVTPSPDTADDRTGAARAANDRTGRGREDMPDRHNGQRQRPPQQPTEWSGSNAPTDRHSLVDPNAVYGNGSRRQPDRGERADAAHLTRNRAPASERNGRRVTDRNGERVRGSSRRASERAAAAEATAAARKRKGKAAKPRKQGPSILDDITRARLEAVAREGAGLRAAWATFRIRTDDLRRMNAAARTEGDQPDGFDRATAQLTDRGYVGAGGGRMNVVGRPVEYRATTAQVAGLWPWSVGAGAPLIGTPLGSHLHTGAPVCFDPMNWFMRGSFITAPSLFVLGLNGFGKSSLVRRIVLGGIAQGITPLILADVKPDYRHMIEMVGGQVIDLGYGHGKLNPLAGGVLGQVVPLLEDLPALQIQVTQELRARQVTLIAGLVELVRGARVRDYEETLISTGLSILYREGSGFAPESPPIMENLLDVIVAGGEQLMLDAGADSADEYLEAIKGLRRSLRALTQGPFGAIFNGQTTTPIDTTAVAVCIDVSHIPTGDKKLKAAVMLSCWADGFASVEAAHVLADADLGAQRYFQVVMDELWQVLGLGDFMVDRVDELTRLQRGLATSLIMISHTIKDLQSLGSEAAIAKAIGFLERARAKIFGALPPEEIKRLDSTVPFTSAEEEMVTGWSAPQALTGEALKPGQARPPAPGTGKFLLKIGEDRRPGIPFHMEFTPSERESGIHETNQRFSEFTESTARRDGDSTGGEGDEGSAA
ncbi:hypothetical protein [Nocardia alni]|uniref:hypothetical protein n=1 Tax=Nocardia alni TaxID=2815723 RepID=UPI0020B3D549|nr:hypothetical protein [Nocardia alni]